MCIRDSKNMRLYHFGLLWSTLYIVTSSCRRDQHHLCAHYILSLIHISEPTRLLSISYAVFCLKKKKKKKFFFFLMIRRPPRSTLDRSSAASDVYKRQVYSDIIMSKRSTSPMCSLY